MGSSLLSALTAAWLLCCKVIVSPRQPVEEPPFIPFAIVNTSLVFLSIKAKLHVFSLIK